MPLPRRVPNWPSRPVLPLSGLLHADGDHFNVLETRIRRFFSQALIQNIWSYLHTVARLNERNECARGPLPALVPPATVAVPPRSTCHPFARSRYTPGSPTYPAPAIS
jgi:hypothetical protein